MTIVELIASLGAQLRVFDLGRRIVELPAPEFAAFENGQAPYATPYLKHAWLGLLSWHNKKVDQNSIWFLKLPLDEQGLIVPAARDAFIQHWAQAVKTPNQAAAPYSFKPDANRMAYFHALVLRSLSQQPTSFYTKARAYLSDTQGFENWQNLGLQGLAEVVVRLCEQDNQTLVMNALPHLPAVVRNVLLGFLENAQPDQNLTSALNDGLAQLVAQEPSAADIAAYARALSNSINIAQRQQLLAAILQHPHSQSVEILAAVARDSWQDLQGSLLLSFLECLARNEQGQPAFNALVADLLALPGVRGQFMQVMASPEKSTELADAFTQLLQGVR